MHSSEGLYFCMEQSGHEVLQVHLRTLVVSVQEPGLSPVSTGDLVYQGCWTPFFRSDNSSFLG